MQSSPGRTHLVLTMEQHTATGGCLAEHFGGNGQFARLEPFDLMVGLVWEHDRGWVDVDAQMPPDPATGLPWSVYETPVSLSIGTGPRSVDHNESCHPYRGLLASMHIVGLFTGRYGLRRERRIDQVDAGTRAFLEPMLAAERERQDRLRAGLAGDERTAAWLDEAVLMRNYKCLQFFDSLALWLQISHPTLRQPSVLEHVPTVGADDATITVAPLDERRVRLDPYPFDSDPLEVVIEGRWLEPCPGDYDVAQELARAEPARQPVMLCAT